MFVGVAGRFIHSLLWGLTQRSHIATGRRPQGIDQVAKRGERFNGNQRGADEKCKDSGRNIQLGREQIVPSGSSQKMCSPWRSFMRL